MIYLHVYLAGLYDLLERGGKQEDIEKIIDEVNNPTQAGFERWLAENQPIACATCGASFKPEGSPKITAEAVCPSCQPALSPS